MKRLRRGGYTIVEAMIFLGISGLMGASAMLLISGQQENTRFVTGVRDVESKMTDIINDVTVGYSPDIANIGCVAPPFINTRPLVGNLGPGQGKNQQCIFVGKGVIASTDAGVRNRLTIYSLIGKRQYQPGAKPENVTNINDAMAGTSSFIQENYTIPQGLEVSEIRYVAAPSVLPTQEFAVVTNLTNTGSSKTILTRPISTLTNHMAVNVSTAGDAAARDGVVVCLRQGLNGRIAAVAIGTQLIGNVPSRTGQPSSAQAYFDTQAAAYGCTAS